MAVPGSIQVFHGFFHSWLCKHPALLLSSPSTPPLVMPGLMGGTWIEKKSFFFFIVAADREKKKRWAHLSGSQCR